jgi:hypothetical protein
VVRQDIILDQKGWQEITTAMAVAIHESDIVAARGTADSSQNESTAISESKAMVVVENANGGW